MIKLSEKYELRGWLALKVNLEEQGLHGVELEEAEDSFYKGIEILSKLFLSNNPKHDKLDSKRMG